jgi:hypothetical protein
MRVGRISLAHPFDRCRKKIIANKDVGALGEEAENQPRYEVIHVVAPRRRSPIGIAFEKLDIELVQARGGPDVERVLANLLDGGDAGERQEKTKVVGKIGIVAGNRFAGIQVLCLQRYAVGRQDELGLVCRRLRVRAELGESLADPTFRAYCDMDVVALKDPARYVR